MMSPLARAQLRSAQHCVTHMVARITEVKAATVENVEYVVMVDREAHGGDVWNVSPS